MKTVHPIPKDNGELELYEAVAKFLKRQGWSVIVAGGCEVQQQADDEANNFEFVMRFTGVRKAGA